MPQPLYTPGDCHVAYQLHWSLTLFASEPWPPADSWRQSLGDAVEADGVRILEFKRHSQDAGQFLVSTKPEAAPAQIVRSIKGRLQYLLRDKIPKFWRRHYCITSVGDASNGVLQGYVGGQVEHHPMADSRTVERLREMQFHDPSFDLATERASSHGRFINSLHIVLENADHLADTRKEWLTTSRDMVVAACQKKGWLLSRLGLVANHLHVLLGCDVTDAPRDVALSLMNNLAYAHGMKRVYESSFYVGTFGPYDHGAIRARLADQCL
jgi:REP element-mobilizing transposase RayT